MKNLLIIYFGLVAVFGCKENETGPTSFEGKVVFADDGSPVKNAVITILAWESRLVPGCCQKDVRRDTLSDENNFFVEFESDEDIQRFDFYVELIESFEILSLNNGLDCSPFDCDNLTPGRAYRDLIIRVPR